MTAPTEAAGVRMSVAEALVLFQREVDRAGGESYIAGRELTTALATLQSRLLAADELREAGDELREAVLESRDALQAFANDGMPPQYIRHMAAEERLAKALAAYDKAGTNEH